LEIAVSRASRIRVVVLYGGRSSEHEVSRISARHVAAAMDPARYEVIPIGISWEGRWLLPDVSRKVLEGGPLEIPDEAFEVSGEPVVLVQDPSRPEIVPIDRAAPLEAIRGIDVVFPVLHGPYGEDGTVQGLLELANLPYVGAGVLGSAVGMDKEKMKILWRVHGLPTPEFLTIRAHEWESERNRHLEAAASFGFPCFTKPANLGSSIGVTKCADREALEAGIDDAFRYGPKVMVEEGISGREIECSVLGNEYPEASVCGEMIAARDFYDYVAKYHDKGTRMVIPAELPAEVSDAVRRYSIQAFKAIDAEGMARVDFFYEAGGRGILVNEINTIPGFTAMSAYPKMWEATGLPYDKLIERLIELALERHRKKPRPEDLPPPV
jgi:D-alanine-D-alanine ligase